MKGHPLYFRRSPLKNTPGGLIDILVVGSTEGTGVLQLCSTALDVSVLHSFLVNWCCHGFTAL